MAEMFDDPTPLDETNPEIREDLFETFKDMGWAPEDIKDEELREPYRAWLRNQK